MGNYDNKVNPSEIKKRPLSYSNNLNTRNTGLQLEASDNMNMSDYLKQLKGHFVFKFYEEKPRAEAFKTIDGQIVYIESKIPALEGNKQFEQANKVKIKNDELYPINSTLLNLKKQIETLGESRNFSTITSGYQTPLPNNADINTELRILEQKIEKAEKEKQKIESKLQKSQQKIDMYIAGIGMCKIFAAQLRIYGKI